MEAFKQEYLANISVLYAQFFIRTSDDDQIEWIKENTIKLTLMF